MLVRGTSDADPLDGGRRACPVERLHGDLEPVALLAEPVGDGHPDVLERDRGRIRRTLPHLVEVPLDRHALRVGRDDEGGQADGVPRAWFEDFLKILSPFAPHVAEELWEQLGHAGSIQKAAWPAFVMNIFEPFRTYSSP